MPTTCPRESTTGLPANHVAIGTSIATVSARRRAGGADGGTGGCHLRRAGPADDDRGIANAQSARLPEGKRRQAAPLDLQHCHAGQLVTPHPLHRQLPAVRERHVVRRSVADHVGMRDDVAPPVDQEAEALLDPRFQGGASTVRPTDQDANERRTHRVGPLRSHRGRRLTTSRIGSAVGPDRGQGDERPPQGPRRRRSADSQTTRRRVGHRRGRRRRSRRDDPVRGPVACRPRRGGRRTGQRRCRDAGPLSRKRAARGLARGFGVRRWRCRASGRLSRARRHTLARLSHRRATVPGGRRCLRSRGCAVARARCGARDDRWAGRGWRRRGRRRRALDDHRTRRRLARSRGRAVARARCGARDDRWAGRGWRRRGRRRRALDDHGTRRRLARSRGRGGRICGLGARVRRSLRERRRNAGRGARPGRRWRRASSVLSRGRRRPRDRRGWRRRHTGRRGALPVAVAVGR